MLNKRNLRDKLARQSGSPLAGSAGGTGGSRDAAGMNHLIETERNKQRAAAGEPEAPKSAAAGKSPTGARSNAAGKGPGAARAAGKSTTNQGLR